MATQALMNDDEPRADIHYDLRILRALRRITRNIALHSKQLAAYSHITAPQLVCLLAVIESGPMTSTAISREISVSPSTVVGILDRLEEKGLVLRERSHEDRRIVLVSATEAGRQLAAEAPSPLQKTLADALNALPELEQATITLSLERIVDLMEARKSDPSPILTSMHPNLHRSQVWLSDPFHHCPKEDRQARIPVDPTSIQPPVAPRRPHGFALERPELSDGANIHRLIQDSPPLDVNSTYAYLLLCRHFHDTCVVALRQECLAGFISAYLRPPNPTCCSSGKSPLRPTPAARASAQRCSGICSTDRSPRRSAISKPRYRRRTSRRAACSPRSRGSAAWPGRADLFHARTVRAADSHEAEKLLADRPF